MTSNLGRDNAFEQVSDNVSLRFRETGFCGAETTASKPVRHIQLIVSRDKVPSRNPANSGLFIGDREISVCRDCVVGLRGLELRANHAVAVEPIPGP